MATFTKKEIRSSFLRLLNERPMNQITVKMIVEDCGINRNTFYYHYHDLQDLVEEILTERYEEFTRSYPTVDSLRGVAETSAAFVAETRRPILNIYRSVSRDIFERYLWKVCDRAVRDYGSKILPKEEIAAEDREAVYRFYKYVCFGLILDWLDDGMQEDIERFTERIHEFHADMPEEMLRRAAAKNHKMS